MHTDRKSTIAAMCEHKLSFAQYYYLMLVYYNDMSLIYQINHCQKPWSRKAILDLVDRGYLINENVDDRMYISDFSAVKSKCEPIFGPLAENGIEFWNAYPDNMYINGKRVSTKSCDKEALIARYNDKIGPSKHNAVMRALEYCKQRDLIQMGIEKWFLSEQWEMIQDEMERNLNLANDEHVF